MANVVPSSLISSRGLRGVHMFNGVPEFNIISDFPTETSKTCRVTAWSSDGKYFAWANGSMVNVVATDTWSMVSQIPKPKTAGLQFSPKRNYLVTWEPYQITKDTPQNTPNLHIWDLTTNQSVKSYVQKRQTGWEPAWSCDEKLLARNINQELQVYEVEKMENLSQRMNDVKVSDFSISPSQAPYHFLCYIQGSKGQPSFVKLFRYPRLDPTGAVANKSFFQADRVEMKWNKTGTCVLLLTSTDVDTSGASYYGKQTLHFLDTKGNTAMVQLPKDGPIYSVEWNPRGNEFCVVYGFMPAKATLFDIKCDPKFDFGTGSRNSAFYNCFGNLLLLGGFGNLRGKIEVWNLKTLKMICQMEAPDSTHLEWNPDGQHILTCTTAPRLRVGNGYKVWHYSGSLLHEHNITAPEELWEATWQPLPEGTYKEFTISSRKVEGIQPAQPQVSKQLYRPPCARGTNAVIKLLEEREPPSVPKSVQPIEPSKNALKNKKKKENRRAKKEQNQDGHQADEKPKVIVKSNVELKLTGDPEKDKQLRSLKKKLDQIAQLKAEEAAGKILELNQREKLLKEQEFIDEIEKLSL